MQSTIDRSKKLKNQNDGTIAMQSQQQTRKRHQTNDSMLNTVQLKQYEASIDERKTHSQRRFYGDQQRQTQIIPQENVIIGIFTKVFRKCFFSTRILLPVSMVSAYSD